MMDSVLEGFGRAFSLIVACDPDLLAIIFLSLKVSGAALLAALLLGLPVGAVTGLKKFPGRNILVALLNTFMGLPPVVAGLFLYLILSRSGPLGFLALLYTPSAMIIAQTILAFPIIAALSHSAIIKVDPLIQHAATTLGATRAEVTFVVLREARYGIIAAVVAALGRVMAEVGAILIVGGNIAGYTRVMTTTIALETDRGNFELALALGIILLMISFMINMTLYLFQKRGIVHTLR